MDDDPKTLAYTIAGPQTPAPVGTHSCPTCGLEIPRSIGSCPKDGTPITVHGDPGLKLVGNYEFLQFIGAGGMGVIYKAKHPVLNRLVAIKMLHGHLVSDAIIKRFKQEAEAVSSLDHRNIIHVHDFGVSEHNQPYMVMDFVEGKPLSEVLQAEPLSLEAVINIMIQLTEGLQHAHDRNVLHRDLKPSNIMVTDYDCEFPEVKIVDFGIAKVIESEKTRMTQTGELIGTPQYMSPEQCRGGTLDARSDIYALGCVMFEALTGKALFAGHSMVSVIVDQMNTAPRTLQETRPDKNFPGQLEDLISKALAKDPPDRYQSMSEFGSDLIALQKVISQQSAKRWSKLRVLRLNKEQRNLFLLLLGSVVTLVTVAVTSISFIKVVHDSRATRVIRPVLSDPLPGGGLLESKSLARRKLLPYLNMSKADDYLMRTFFDVDTLAERLDLDNQNITSLSMPNIALQKHVESLHLEGTKTTGADLAFIATMPSLTRLYLDRTRVSDEGLKLLGKMKNLRKLSLLDTHISDKGLAYLPKDELEDLLVSSPQVSGAGVAVLGGFPKLKELVLAAYYPKGEKNLSALASAKQLVELDLNHSAITADDLSEVAQIAGLEKLNLSTCDIEEGALLNLKPLENLKELNLTATKVSGARVKELAQLAHLQELILSDTDITDDLLAQIAQQLPNLKVLDLQETAVTEKGVLQLRSMPALKALVLEGSAVSKRSMETLGKALAGVAIKI